jgi:hypothetical protein
MMEGKTVRKSDRAAGSFNGALSREERLEEGRWVPTLPD